MGVLCATNDGKNAAIAMTKRLRTLLRLFSHSLHAPRHQNLDFRPVMKLPTLISWVSWQSFSLDHETEKELLEPLYPLSEDLLESDHQDRQD